MNRYWAAWVSSWVLRGLAFIIAGSWLMLVLSVVLDEIGVIPLRDIDQQAYLLWMICGLPTALVVFGLGQGLSLLIEVHDRQERLINSLTRRRSAAVSTASTAAVEEEGVAPTAPQPYRLWRRADDPTAFTARELRFRRMASKPAVPEAEPEDPRRVRVYTKQVIVTDAPESRIPRPKAKG